MIKDYENLQVLTAKSVADFKEYHKKNLKWLKKIDCEIHELHNTYTDKINCLLCANCCKALGPLVILLSSITDQRLAENILTPTGKILSSV